LRRLPNVLSASRIVAAIAILLLSGRLDAARFTATAIVLLIALITDFLDGYLARRSGQTTELGYILDTMGDRAVHLALLLIFLVRYDFSPLIVWLLIFRDIGIYAVRLLARNWLSKSLGARWLSKVNAGALRLWLGLFLARDGFRVFRGADVLGTPTFNAIQLSVLVLTLVASYYSFAMSFRWLLEVDSRPH
jgi:CDP-diacylglycerol--glycerol-3-phosphate 3-phosphatidyltransferase